MKTKDLELFKKIPTLYTERLILRAISVKDAMDIYDYASDPLVSKWLLWNPHTSFDFSRRFAEQLERGYRDMKYYTWGVEFNGKMIGTCGFSAFDIKINSAQVGYVLSSKYWGIGLATEATRKVIKFGFDVLELSTIESRYIIENEASRRVAEKCGMRYFTTVKNAFTHRTGKRDMGISVITKEEYCKNT